MPNVTCSSCGGKISIPEGHSRAKIRCGGCGYYADVPVEYRSAATDKDAGDIAKAKAKKPDTSFPKAPFTSKPAKAKRLDQDDDDSDEYGFEEEEDLPEGKVIKSRKAKPNANPADPRPNFEPDAPAGKNLLEGDDIERDGTEATPYTVPGTGLKKCPECRGELPLDASFCVHCGTDFETKKGKKPKREYTPIFKEWEVYARADVRLKVFIGLQPINVALGALSLFVREFNILEFVAYMIMQVGMQAFLLGSFDMLTVKRSPKGRAEIFKTWRFFFIPMEPQKIDWKVSHATAIVATHNPGPVEWGVMLYLLCFGCLPGLLFYWFVIRPERFDVVLCDVHGGTDQVLFRTTTRDLADDVCRTISEATKLMYRTI